MYPTGFCTAHKDAEKCCQNYQDTGVTFLLFCSLREGGREREKKQEYEQIAEPSGVYKMDRDISFCLIILQLVNKTQLPVNS